MFKRITAENLLSWESLDYEVFQGISQVTGWNYDDNTSEACGKSSVFNILCWVLYGKIPKDANIDDVIMEGKKSGFGTVTLNSGEIIHRRRKPNELYISLVDESGASYGKKQGKDAKETQIMINQLIGMDFDSFCQVVYFAQGYPKRFIAANEAEKAAVLSEIQDLAIFDRARKDTVEQIKNVAAKQTSLEKEQLALQAENVKLTSNAQLLAEFLDKFEAEKAEKSTQLTQIIANYQEEISELNECLVDSTELSAEISNIDTMLSELIAKKAECQAETKLYEQSIRERAQAEKNIKDLRARSNKLAQEVEDNNACGHDCPVCGQTVPEAAYDKVFKKAKQVKDELAAVTTQWKQACQVLKNIKEVASPEKSKEFIAEIDEEASKLKDVKKVLQDKLTASLRAGDKISGLKKNIEKATAEKVVVEAKQPTKELSRLVEIDEALSALNHKIADKGVELKNNKTLLDNLNILKDGFREVKSYVFQSVLAELSHKSTLYASELFGISVNLRFHNEGEDGEIAKINTLVTLNGVERSIGLTSGGQYARLGLAINLALSDIVSNRRHRPIKFRIFDEPFKDMSETSMSRAIKLFEKLEGNTILIEHAPTVKSIVDKTFNIEYRNKISHAA